MSKIAKFIKSKSRRSADPIIEEVYVDALESLSITESPSFHGKLQLLSLNSDDNAKNTTDQQLSGGTPTADFDMTVTDLSMNGTDDQLPTVSNAFDASDLGHTTKKTDTQRTSGSKSLLKRKSRLSKSLMDTFQDPSSQAYFIQFMERLGLDHLVKFWLEAEHFCVAVSAANDASLTDASGDSSSLALSKALEQDAVHIFSKFISEDANFPIGLPVSARKIVIERICSEDRQSRADAFQPAQKFVVDIIEQRYFPSFKSSVYYSRHVLDLLYTGPVFLSDIVYNDSALFYLFEFLDQLDVRRLLEFWLVTESFRDQVISHNSSVSNETLQNDAMILYDRYFSLQATTPVGFSDEVRFAVEGNICREEGPLPDCFDIPMLYVWNLLEREYLPRFLKSPLYAKFLDELITVVKNSLDLPHSAKLHRRAASTTAASDLSSGSDRFFNNFPSSARSLPPGEMELLRDLEDGKTTRKSSVLTDRKAQARQMQVKNLSMDGGIDTRNYDPEVLWKRPESGGLLLGSIDYLGDYRSDIGRSSIPHAEEKQSKKQKMKSNTSSRLPKSMRKLMNSEPNQEEIDEAARMAQSILQDIHQMTQNYEGL